MNHEVNDHKLEAKMVKRNCGEIEGYDCQVRISVDDWIDIEKSLKALNYGRRFITGQIKKII